MNRVRIEGMILGLQKIKVAIKKSSSQIIKTLYVAEELKIGKDSRIHRLQKGIIIRTNRVIRLATAGELCAADIGVFLMRLCFKTGRKGRQEILKTIVFKTKDSKIVD